MYTADRPLGRVPVTWAFAYATPGNPAVGGWPRLCGVNIFLGILLVLHLLGWALVLGGTLTNLRTPRIAPGVLHGILTALVTGIVMAGLISSGATDEDPNNPKFAVKLVVAAVATGLVIFGSTRPERVTRRLLLGIAVLVVLNVSIAVLWT